MERNPVELTRFLRIEEITTEVVEQMLVDALEHVFGGRRLPSTTRAPAIAVDLHREYR